MNGLHKAETARDKYLSEKPNLVEYQQQIDDILSKVHENERMEVLALLIAGKMTELKEALGELQKVISETSM